MKIIDSHCHAWATWPYSTDVPDPESRGVVGQLLYEMNVNGVDEAVIVSAQIRHNPENNAYGAAQVERYPDKLHQFVDIDSFWSPTYHKSGGGERLYQAAHRWRIKGFTHYVDAKDDGSWYHSSEGQSLFQTAANLNLIASIHCQAHQQPTIRFLAECFPTVPILCHHLGHVAAEGPNSEAALRNMLKSSEFPNIYVKLSGFAYASEIKWDFPFLGTHNILKAEYEHFGRRMCWGSDYPVVRAFMTYKHALEAFRTHCTFVSDEDRSWILGGTLDQLLSHAGNQPEAG